MPIEIPEKTYFKIGEVAKLIGVKPYIIRYWESEFRGLRPAKTKSRQRLFRRKDIELLLIIKTLLYDQKFKIAGARQKLKEMSQAGLSYPEILESLEQGTIAVVAPTDGTDGDGSTQPVLSLGHGVDAPAVLSADQARAAEATAEAEQAAKEAERAARARQRAEEALERERQERLREREERERLTRAAEDAAERTQTLDEELEEAQRERARLRAEADNLRGDLERVRAELDETRRRLDTLRGTHGRVVERMRSQWRSVLAEVTTDPPAPDA